MPNIFDGDTSDANSQLEFKGGPGVGHVSGIFKKPPVGVVIVGFRFPAPGGTGKRVTSQVRNSISEAQSIPNPFSSIGVLVQSFNLSFSERVDEVLTLSETEHIYTFGRTLPKVSVSGLLINKNTEIIKQGKIARPSSKEIVKNWEEGLRAKMSGIDSKPTALVKIDSIGRVLKGVATQMTLGSSVQQEAMIQISLQIIITEGFESESNSDSRSTKTRTKPRAVKAPVQKSESTLERGDIRKLSNGDFSPIDRLLSNPSINSGLTDKDREALSNLGAATIMMKRTAQDASVIRALDDALANKDINKLKSISKQLSKKFQFGSFATN